MEIKNFFFFFYSTKGGRCKTLGYYSTNCNLAVLNLWFVFYRSLNLPFFLNYILSLFFEAANTRASGGGKDSSHQQLTTGGRRSKLGGKGKKHICTHIRCCHKGDPSFFLFLFRTHLLRRLVFIIELLCSRENYCMLDVRISDRDACGSQSR